MIEEIAKLLEECWKWEKNNTYLKQIDDWIAISTPYLDRHNDMLQIYAKREGDSFILTDDGYILQDLELSGCKLDSPKRKQILETTLNGFGIKIEERALVIRASKKDFPYKRHSLIQAMLSINDMFYLATSTVKSLFLEDVISWFDKNDIRYIQNAKFSGISGYDRLFELSIPKTRKYPDRFLKLINDPNKNSVSSMILDWVDIKDVRPSNAQAYAIINDSNKTISPSVFDAFSNYGINPFPWSDKENRKEELVA
jgi:hypothetical protein